MTFRFNFSTDDQDVSDNDVEVVQGQQTNTKEENVDFIPAREFVVNESVTLPPTFICNRITLSHSVSIFKRHLSDIKLHLAQSNADHLLDVSADSDLVIGVYEGGLKTWESAGDLLEYLGLLFERGEFNVEMSGKCLELGCGSSLPGVYMLVRCPLIRVDFQDYNEQVIGHVTIPNILLNTALAPSDNDIDKNNTAEVDIPDSSNLLEKVTERSKFFSGDWSGLKDVLDMKSNSDKYDIILTSETIYNISSMPKLYNVIKESLKRPTGIAYVAAKTMYFGVGGGVLPFKQLVEADGIFNIEVVFNVTHDVKREVLELRYK
ncbi:8391_t:CDS:2 [Paraglomus brasilianum]|uniref:protein-histidine N-methyltransferase n=1 Tax=Paraglomus brasilianum TaxID=144538 RepID=A0A9N8W303_9GLOM|nr:8391_t:CDS:2 [Paraglomus brasilianum]